MDKKAIYSIKESEVLIAKRLRSVVRLKYPNFAIGLLFLACKLNKEMDVLTYEQLEMIYSKIYEIGKDNFEKYDNAIEQKAESKIKEIYDNDRKLNSIQINIDIDNSAHFSKRRLFKHLQQIGKILQQHDIIPVDIKKEFKKMVIQCTYSLKANKHDLIEEIFLENPDLKYREIAEKVGCSEDMVKKSVPKILKQNDINN